MGSHAKALPESSPQRIICLNIIMKEEKGAAPRHNEDEETK